MLNKKIIVIGGGESGCGAALLAKKQGYNVFLSDSNIIKDNYKKLLQKFEINWEEKGHDIKHFNNVNEVVKSPGISDKSIIIRKLKDLKIKIISRNTSSHVCTIVSIFGSN